MGLKNIGFSLIIAIIWVACAPKKFEKDPDADKCQNFSENCISADGVDYFDYTVKENGGLVDIVFINDNSGSMSPEQSQMAVRFKSFLSILDSRYIDYQIGVITTDISSSSTETTSDDSGSSSLYNPPRAINKSGALQDGRLIQYDSGEFVLKPTSVNKEILFSSIIERPETKQCEEFLKKYPDRSPTLDEIRENCPSGDERGIFAANLFLDNNSATIRDKAHLAFVVLSDEDVRSGLYLNQANYSLESKDTPEALMAKVKAKYPNKQVSFHSIIVRPGDSACEQIQDHQMGPSSINPTNGVIFNQIQGSQGQIYAQATKLFGGITGDICANDYGSQLASIGANIVDRVSQIQIACDSPGNLSVEFSPAEKSVDWTLQSKMIRLQKSMDPGVQLHLKYTCRKL